MARLSDDEINNLIAQRANAQDVVSNKSTNNSNSEKQSTLQKVGNNIQGVSQSAVAGALNSFAEPVLGVNQLGAAALNGLGIGKLAGYDFVAGADKLANNYKNAYNDIVKDNPNIAMASGIASSLIGGGGAAKLFPKAAQAVSKLPLLGKIAVGAIAGGTQGGISPVYNDRSDRLEPRLGNIALGATVGSALPVIGAAGSFIDDKTTKVFTNSRAAKDILDKTGLKKQQLADIIKSSNLNNNVEGVTKSLPEVLRDNNLSNNKVLGQYKKLGKQDVILDQLAQNNKARVDTLRNVRGTDANVANLEKIRSDNASKNYSALKPVKINKDIEYALGLKGVKENIPVVQENLNAKTLNNTQKVINRRADGRYLDPSVPEQITRRLNQQASPSALTNVLPDDAMRLKNTARLFNDVIETADPSYAIPRQQYAQDSIPLNDGGIATILESTGNKASPIAGYNQLNYSPYRNQLDIANDIEKTPLPPSPQANEQFNNVLNSLESENYLKNAGATLDNEGYNPRNSDTLIGAAKNILLEPAGSRSKEALASLLVNPNAMQQQLSSGNYSLYNNINQSLPFQNDAAIRLLNLILNQQNTGE